SYAPISNDSPTRQRPPGASSLRPSCWTTTPKIRAGDSGAMPNTLVPRDPPPPVVLQALLAEDLIAFTEFAFYVVRPNVTFKANWHIEVITAKLAQVASGEVNRLIINVPPRTLKTLCASVALPAWFLGHNPWERVVVISYSEILARSHSNDF